MTSKATCINEANRWNALIRREQVAEDAFFYAVKTTGVFCRPGCSSRLPKRENVEFFDTCEEAERAGYRPCKRCKPDSAAPQERLLELIIQACRSIEQSVTPPTLDKLAAEADLSPWHFHRLFRKTVGITPKQYGASLQGQRFRNSLKTEKSVTAAIYDAGFSSSGRAYDNARNRLAMAPSTYLNGSTGLTIRYGVARCFLGWIIVAAIDRGVCAIEFGDDPETLRTQVQACFPKAQFKEADSEFASVIEQVVAFIEAPGAAIDLPLDIQGTAFQERVWHALRQVPPGSTISYADLAERIGAPEAVRAVAQACAANKLAVAVPCHRVVRSDGKLSGYRWGVERKHVLLIRERSMAGDINTPAPKTNETERPAATDGSLQESHESEC